MKPKKRGLPWPSALGGGGRLRVWVGGCGCLGFSCFGARGECLACVRWAVVDVGVCREVLRALVT